MAGSRKTLNQSFSLGWITECNNFTNIRCTLAVRLQAKNRIIANFSHILSHHRIWYSWLVTVEVVSTVLSSSQLLRSSTISRKPKSIILSAENITTTCTPAWIQTVLGGLYELEGLWGVQARSELNPIPPLLFPVDCGMVLTIPKLRGTEYLVDVKLYKASRGARGTLHPAWECVVACNQCNFNLDVSLACFGADPGFSN